MIFPSVITEMGTVHAVCKVSHIVNPLYNYTESEQDALLYVVLPNLGSILYRNADRPLTQNSVIPVDFLESERINYVFINEIQQSLNDVMFMVQMIPDSHLLYSTTEFISFRDNSLEALNVKVLLEKCVKQITTTLSSYSSRDAWFKNPIRVSPSRPVNCKYMELETSEYAFRQTVLVNVLRLYFRIIEKREDWFWNDNLANLATMMLLYGPERLRIHFTRLATEILQQYSTVATNPTISIETNLYNSFVKSLLGELKNA